MPRLGTVAELIELMLQNRLAYLIELAAGLTVVVFQTSRGGGRQERYETSIGGREGEREGQWVGEVWEARYLGTNSSLGVVIRCHNSASSFICLRTEHEAYSTCISLSCTQ